MSADQNKTVVRQFFDDLNAGNLDVVVADLLAPGYRLHFDSSPPLDREGAQRFLRAFLAAFPDLHHSIEDQVAEGDRVVSRIRVRGQHQAMFQGIAPTGKEIDIAAINIHWLGGGKIIEQWVASDGLGMLQQLGVVPAPSQAPASVR